MVANYSLYPSYSNWGQFNDRLEDLTMGGGFNYDPLSMSQSVFPNSFVGGINGGGAMTQEEYNKRQVVQVQADTNLSKEQIDGNNNVARHAKTVEILNQTKDSAGKSAAGKLHDLAVADRQDLIPVAYANLLKVAREELEANGDKVSEEDVKNRAEEIYTQATNKRLTDDLEQHGTPQFIHGLEQGFLGLGWLLTDNKTAKDNIAEITGQPISKADQFQNIAGIVVGGALSIVALPLLLIGCKKIGIAAFSKSATSFGNLVKPNELEAAAKAIK